MRVVLLLLLVKAAYVEQFWRVLLAEHFGYPFSITKNDVGCCCKLKWLHSCLLMITFIRIVSRSLESL
jgi:hypothetical protein